MRLYLVLVALLHAIFAFCELFPWSYPILLSKVATRLPDLEPPADTDSRSSKFTADQLSLIGAIVHNAGIYNLILAAGLAWSAWHGSDSSDLAVVLLLGAALAGSFGAITLKSPIPIIQAISGLIGAILLLLPRLF